MKAHHQAALDILVTIFEISAERFKQCEDRYEVVQGIQATMLSLHSIEVVMAANDSDPALLSMLDQVLQQVKDEKKNV